MKTKLKVLRAEHMLSQEDLAKILGSNQKSVSAWERGVSTPRPPMMQKIEDFFGIPKEKIFFTAFNYQK